MTPPEPIGAWAVAADDPTRPAVIDADGTSTTFEHLTAAANRISHGLRRLGLEAGDMVAVVLPNHRSFLEVYLATTQIGLYLTPVNIHLAPREVAHVLADSGARAVFAHEAVADLAREAADDAAIPADRRFAYGAVEGFRPIDALVDGCSTDRPDERRIGQLMMYTSGTTGYPKGVRRPLSDGDPDDVLAMVTEVTCRGFDVPPGPGTHLTCGPLYHAGPFLGATCGIHYGYTVVLMERFDPEEALGLIDSHRVRTSQMVPTMFHRLLAVDPERRARYDVSSLRSVLHTGAPCPVPVKRQMMDWWGPVLYETYGGTEAAATIAKPHRWLEKPGTVGKPIHGVTIEIVDDDGASLPPGTPGLVYIASAHQSLPTYHGDPEKTASIRRGNAVTLGDVGYLDEDGYLFLCDRKIDMIIAGGVNIYPAEIEAVLLEHASVFDAAVIGIPSDEWGEEVLAIIVASPGFESSSELADDLIGHCRQHLARFKCPRTVEFRNDLPRLPSGKVLKRDLRAPYWNERAAPI